MDEGGVPDIERLKYAEIPDIDKEMAKDLKWKLRAGIANVMDRKMKEKYDYSKMVKENLTQELKEGLFNKFFASDKYNKYQFRQ